MCDSDIVGEIITQLLSTEDSIKHEQGISLLAKISNNSVGILQLAEIVNNDKYIVLNFKLVNITISISDYCLIFWNCVMALEIRIAYYE